MLWEYTGPWPTRATFTINIPANVPTNGAPKRRTAEGVGVILMRDRHDWTHYVGLPFVLGSPEQRARYAAGRRKKPPGKLYGRVMHIRLGEPLQSCQGEHPTTIIEALKVLRDLTNQTFDAIVQFVLDGMAAAAPKKYGNPHRPLAGVSRLPGGLLSPQDLYKIRSSVVLRDVPEIEQVPEPEHDGSAVVEALNRLDRPDEVLSWVYGRPTAGLRSLQSYAGLRRSLTTVAYATGAVPVLDQEAVLLRLLKESLYRRRASEDDMRYQLVPGGWDEATTAHLDAIDGLEGLAKLCDIWDYGLKKKKPTRGKARRSR